IAKTGSLCCVAARPHGSNAASGEWSLDPQEPYWQTNTSFSPRPSRWDLQYQPEELSFGSQDGVLLYGSSTSSNSRGSRNWIRGIHIYNHQHSTSDGVGTYFSSPSEISPVQQWTPSIQEIRGDDYGNSSRRVQRPSSFSPTMEGTVTAQDSAGSTSSRSDGSESDPIVKSSQQRPFPSRRYFMSKPVHPMSYLLETPTEEVSNRSESDAATTPQRDLSSWSGSIDLTTEAPDLFECESSGGPLKFKCGLCEKYLFQRSPWSSHRIVRSGDMPVAGVLSCRHVFHAECLDQTTPKGGKSDPPCPLCMKQEEETASSPEQKKLISKLKGGLTKHKPFNEELTSSRPWGGCVQAGDCLEGALQAPSRNTMLLLNRSRMRKTLTSKPNPPVTEFPGKLRKNGTLVIGGKSND
ncbi:uncharacterized protein LOC124926834, partial [Impatiens glandulifera]|uniref:uncharacterized protein LOC124926834 n=1 Tax=Impatiens glandulifera TaxID=253017 RepID=UPI001FB1237F